MYHYHDINDDDFEKLVLTICKEILGMGAVGFTPGADGGRDAKFTGTANLYPSQSSPWTGTTIIQAKHTSGINKDFLQPDFFSETSDSCILAKEVKKISALIESDDLDNYMLFSNRKMSGGADLKIKTYISAETGLQQPNIAVLGISELNFYMDLYPHAVRIGNLCPLTIAPIIRPDDLSKVIDAFSKAMKNDINVDSLSSLNRTTFAEKNMLNNMTEPFAQSLQKAYLQETLDIQNFLNDPQNQELLEKYTESTEEFQQTFIIPKQRTLDYFDEIFNLLVELLISRNYLLSINKRLTRLMVFYMYWNCDIGINKND